MPEAVNFTVVLATRDRPGLFAEALASVLAQDQPDVEVVVVNDGSRDEHLPAYQAVWQAAATQLGPRFRVQHLLHRPNGHGQSYALNVGVERARTTYVCFLDDDDHWTDPGHLRRAAQAVRHAAATGEVLDLFMSNQEAWQGAPPRLVGTLWLGELAEDLRRAGRQPDADGNFRVDVSDLMRASGFCHLNCLTVRRQLYLDVGGMDEGIRWECDRDLYLKLVEAARSMWHHPGVMSYHRVPDAQQAVNMTTRLAMADKRLLQNIVLDRALLRSRQPAILRHAQAHKAFALQKLAETLGDAGRWPQAALYARQGLAARFSPGGLRLWWRCQRAAVRQRGKP